MMTIRTQKLILHFLEILQIQYESSEVPQDDFEIKQLLDRKTLIEMNLWVYTHFKETQLQFKTDEELFENIKNKSTVLFFLIDKLEKQLTATPSYSQKEVNAFFEEVGLHFNYLRTKPVTEWDGYDQSNYLALLLKRGKAKRVYAVFTSDVKEEDKYIVTTKPSFFFDTEEEAEAQMESFYLQPQTPRGSLKVMSLWKIN